MKKIFAAIITLISTIAYSQTFSVPQSISHRGTAYKPDGTLVISLPIKIQIEILNYTSAGGPSGGTPIYKETFNPQTNIQGQYSVNIGTGTPIALPSGTVANFNTIIWGDGFLKYLKVYIDPLNSATPNYTVIGGNQLVSVPYALFSQTSQNTNSSIRTYNNINELRTVTANTGDIVYIKGHTYFGDGGQGSFIWKTNVPTNDIRFNDNDGTIIRPLNYDITTNTTGWFRLIDGRINVKYFGMVNPGTDDGEKIQKAIDFAANNADVTIPSNGAYFRNYTIAGSVVYIPAGYYNVKNTLILKSGVSIEGESIFSTILTADNSIKKTGSMIEMAAGRIYGVNVSNLNLNGGVPTGNPDNSLTSNDPYKNCFGLTAQPGLYGDGGLWNCTFKNIRISGFNGSGIVLQGGGFSTKDSNVDPLAYKLPNQDCIFENINIARQRHESDCLLIRGQQGQLTFINCGFDGLQYASGSNFKTTKFFNVVVESNGVESSVIRFLTCTFQYSEYGAFIKYGEDITFDNCWFENLDNGVAAVKSTSGIPSKSINILNSRFANASGFGSLWNKFDNRNSYPNASGTCIYVDGGSQVNVRNNYLLVSDTNNINFNNFFIRNYLVDSEINASGNTFQDSRLSKTFGITNKTISFSGTMLDTSGYRFVNVTNSSSSTNINELKSNISAGETLTIRANGSLKFDGSKNIIFAKTSITPANPFTLLDKEIATFMKTDNSILVSGITYYDSWILISVNKTY